MDLTFKRHGFTQCFWSNQWHTYIIYDVHYCFTLFDTGQYVTNSDAVVLANSSICKQLEAKEINFPPPKHLNNCLLDSCLTTEWEMKHFLSECDAIPTTNTLADGLIKRTLSMLDETESKTVDKDEVGDR